MTFFAKACERRALERVGFTFALSEYTKASVQRIAPKAQVDMGICGVDVNRLHPATNPSGNYVLSVGRFADARKNLPLLLQAYSRLSHRRDLPDLYLVGNPPQMNEAMTGWISKLGFSDKLHFLGPKSGDELAELYRHACFFVLSSDEEGLGIVVLEAMASGLAVVSTDCGGPRTSVIPDVTGFLVPTGNAEALAAAMERLVEDRSLRQRMGQAGRRTAEERFSVDSAGTVFFEKYDELLSLDDNRSLNLPKTVNH
jgi:glycosyltransferase involved in cell wall biosynthesis